MEALFFCQFFNATIEIFNFFKLYIYSKKNLLQFELFNLRKISIFIELGYI
jgi:hypothetical protein